jgi:carbonic anhydrase
MSQVRQTAEGQYPMAAILGCIDSRVPHEIVFDKGVGDVFSARVAGNFINTDILGSLEFATAAAGSKVIVVLGHTECGAVKGACDGVELGNLTSTLANIAPAIYAVGDEVSGPRTSANAEYVQAVAHENVHQTVQNIVNRSPVIRGLVESGDLIVVGAMHDVTTGEVTFYEDEMMSADTLGD